MIQTFKNALHRVFEMDEVNPVFRIYLSVLSFVIGVPEGSAARVELVEFDDPLPDRKRDLDDLLPIVPGRADLRKKARVRAEPSFDRKCGRERPSPRQYSRGRTSGFPLEYVPQGSAQMMTSYAARMGRFGG